MSVLSRIGRFRWAAVAAALLLQPNAAGAPLVEDQTRTKQNLREARSALREGRLGAAFEAYERLLEADPTDPQRFQALYNTALIGASSGAETGADPLADPLAGPTAGPTAGSAAGRLEALEALAATGDFGHDLEIRALVALARRLETLGERLEEEESERSAESAAAKAALVEERRVCAEAHAAQEALLGAGQRERLMLEQRIALLEGYLDTREEELEARVEDLGRCATEMRFVLDQLEGTQASEVQMLQVVMRKNEELAKTRLELQRRERKLAEQAQELEVKEAEVRTREEAIREVTERVLGQAPPDS